ncbi:type VI secretion system-associated FHA domain protein TagH [Paraburkholderia sp. BR10954]|uniref:type VI secretion system-associated FHA domain protein TagH n=1 Tax=Paraburkholderia sp. BR10954 TaxID=3236995 RepID=UPI0034D32E31
MSAAQRLILSIEARQATQSGARIEQVFDCRDGSIGRSDECDWMLGAEGVSRLHAVVRYLNGMYFIEDRSTNGMSLNGTPLRKGDPAALEQGDRLLIDTFEISVRLSGNDETEAKRRGDPEGPHDPARTSPAVPAAPMAARASAPAPEPAPARNEDPLDLSLLLAPRRTTPAEHIGESAGLILGVADGSGPGASLDPLALFDAPSSYADEPPPRVSAAPRWNHTPAAADRFRPPRAEAAPLAGPVLPEDWDAVASLVPVPREPAQSEPVEVASTTGGGHRVEAQVPSPPDPPAAPDTTAELKEMFHIAVEAMMDVLHARAELKNSFRLPATLIQRAENNPLKFAPTAQDAVQRLLAPPDGGFLAGRAALNDAADDIRNHQMAMLAGVRSAFRSMLTHFDPARIEQETGGGKRRFSLGARPRYWERYKQHFETVTRNPDECFQRLFGDEFARAYEEQLASLKKRRDA